MASNYPASLDNDASLLLAKDLAVTTLASPVSSSATTLPLNPASGGTSAFPATGGIIKIDNELIKYTGINGNDLTGATRGYSGTSASAHSTSAEVRLVVAADYHNNLKDAIIALEQRLGANGQMAVIDGLQLRTGVQEEGRVSARGYFSNTSMGVSVEAPFRAKMSNTPSSITLANAVETVESNLGAGMPLVEAVSLYGFVFTITANVAPGEAYSLSKKYVTVGN